MPEIRCSIFAGKFCPLIHHLGGTTQGKHYFYSLLFVKSLPMIRHQDIQKHFILMLFLLIEQHFFLGLKMGGKYTLCHEAKNNLQK